MSVSILSETSKEEVETEDMELHDLVYNLMSHQGLLSELRGRISKFMEDNGTTDDINVIPERANAKLLGLVFDYLQWVGMKQTSSILLSESPVETDLSTFEMRIEERDDTKPELLRLFEEYYHREEEEEDERGSPSKSHNYSKDEFDSKISSGSAHPSLKGNENDEVEDLASDNEEEEEASAEEINLLDLKKSHESAGKDSSSASSRHSKHDTSSLRKECKAKNQSPSSSEHDKSMEPKNKTISADAADIGTPSNKNHTNVANNMFSLESSPVDFSRPHVTVRQKTDVSPPPCPSNSRDAFQNPFTSNPGQNYADFSIPIVTSDNRLDFVRPNKTMQTAAGTNNGNIVNPENNPIPPNDNSSNPFLVPGGTTITLSDTKNSKVVEQTVPLKKGVENKDTSQSQASQEEDDSTSDFMETLTMEEDTQDISIPSESKGMSSCEHALNLK